MATVASPSPASDLALLALGAMPAISRALSRQDHSEALARLALVYRHTAADDEEAIRLARTACAQLA